MKIYYSAGFKFKKPQGKGASGVIFFINSKKSLKRQLFNLNSKPTLINFLIKYTYKKGYEITEVIRDKNKILKELK